MKVIQVLRTLMLSPEGSALSNENVCEVMLSCFRICFEPRLNELLRRTAEHALKDIVLLLFMRLPQFAEERQGDLVRKLKMIAGSIDSTNKKQRKSKTKGLISKTNATRKQSIKIEDGCTEIGTDGISSPSAGQLHALKVPVLATTPATPAGNIVDMQGKFMQTPTSTLVGSSNEIAEDGMVKVSSLDNLEEKPQLFREDSVENDADIEEDAGDNAKEDDTKSIESENKEHKNEDFVNSMGVRFIPQAENGRFSYLLKLTKIYFPFWL